MKVVVCDIDNTLLDTLTRLEEIHPDFNQEEQTTYRLRGKLLKEFGKKSFYDRTTWNWEVLGLLHEFVENGYEVIFVSQTISYQAALSKEDIVETWSAMTGHPATLHIHDGIIDYVIRRLVADADDLTHLVAIDDAPERLMMHEPVRNHRNVDVFAMEYPYNKDLIKELGYKTLKSNRFKSK